MTSPRDHGLTKARLDQLLSYDPESGQFRRVSSINRLNKSGKVAGCRHCDGYTKIKVDGNSHLAHRLAFLSMTGAFPEKFLDHINGKRDDNRWENLREVTHQENQMNRPLQRNSKSGMTGVLWDNRKSKWRASIGINNKRLHLGHFDCKESARAAYLDARRKAFLIQPIPREIILAG